MTEEERDKRKKRKKYLKENLEKIGFPCTELKKLGYNVNFLLEVLEEILDIDSDKKSFLKRLVINVRGKDNVENYRSNFFDNFLRLSDEKNLNYFLKELLKKYDEEKYKIIEFDERGNIYQKENFSSEDFIIQVEEFFEVSQKLQEKLINRILNGEIIYDLNKIIDNLKIKVIFCNDDVKDDTKKILRIFIIFIYWEWQKMLLENILTIYKKGLNKVGDYLKNRTLDEEYSEISSLNALSEFLNRDKKNKRDIILKEKLKKLYVFTEGKLKDYSLDENYPINKLDILIIDNIFQNIFFNDEREWGHKLDYYLKVYRKNRIINEIFQKLDRFEKAMITIMYEDKLIKLREEILLDILKIYEDFYTLKELKEFNRIEIKIKEEISFLKKLQECDESTLVLKLKEYNKKNENKNIEKIYKILILSELNDEQKILLIGCSVDGFKLDNRYIESEVLEERFFENIKPLNREIDVYLGILLNMYRAKNLKEELLKIIYLLEKFRDIKPILY